MSKYIVEIKPEYEDSFKGLMILGAKDSNLFVDTLAVDDLEQLNSDYINEHYGQLQDDAYQRGLDDAWECAKELYLNGACKDLFGEYFNTFIKNHTAQEAIEKLKAYEAEQGHSDTIDESYTIGYKQANNNSKSNTECDGCLYDDGIKEHSLCHTCSNAYINHWTAKPQEDEEIKVGDEVETKDGKRFAVTTFLDGDIAVGICADGVGRGVDLKELRKTGRHFDIEKILEEMRG